MNWKTWAPAALAVVLGGAAAKLVRDSMLKSRPAATKTIQTVQVVVANTNLVMGTEIKPETLSVSAINAPTPPPDAFLNPAELAGRILITPVTKGQPILGSNLAPRGATAGIASLVPAGMRALTINVDESNSIAGMLVPGCRIDVLAATTQTKEPNVHILVKDVLVQAVGQRLTAHTDEKDPAVYRTVTLIVTPHDAEALELATLTARTKVILRGSARADGEVDPGFLTLSDIMGKPAGLLQEVATTQPAVVRVTPLPPEKRKVELIKGAGAAPSRVEFEIPNPVDAGMDLKPMLPSGDEHIEE